MTPYQVATQLQLESVYLNLSMYTKDLLYGGVQTVGFQVSCSAGGNSVVWDGRFPVSKYIWTSLYMIGHSTRLDNQAIKQSSNFPIISIIPFNIDLPESQSCWKLNEACTTDAS